MRSSSDKLLWARTKENRERISKREKLNLLLYFWRRVNFHSPNGCLIHSVYYTLLTVCRSDLPDCLKTNITCSLYNFVSTVCVSWVWAVIKPTDMQKFLCCIIIAFEALDGRYRLLFTYSFLSRVRHSDVWFTSYTSLQTASGSSIPN